MNKLSPIYKLLTAIFMVQVFSMCRYVRSALAFAPAQLKTYIVHCPELVFVQLAVFGYAKQPVCR
jgi:hypothetical protein